MHDHATILQKKKKEKMCNTAAVIWVALINTHITYVRKLHNKHKTDHYENTAIQIYRQFHLQKLNFF